MLYSKSSRCLDRLQIRLLQRLLHSGCEGRKSARIKFMALIHANPDRLLDW